MLLIKNEFIAKAQSADSVAIIQELLAGAVTLELSTLPPYLTGVFSLMPGANDEARVLMQSVVLQEMLHMALAANTAIAIGGSLPIRSSGLALRYPGPLPMMIDEGLQVSLGSLTTTQVQDVFMGIEHPDTDAILPGETSPNSAVALKQQGFASIGQFYMAIIAALRLLVNRGQDPFANPQLDRQLDLSPWFPRGVPGNPSGKVSDMDSAQAALETIIRQGEGAQVDSDPIDPYAGGTELAHYFKFGEIAFGHRLIQDATMPSGWAYGGAPVPLVADKVFVFPANAKVGDYPAGSAARIVAEAFYETYVRLLTALDQTFNGNPAMFDAALGIMFELKLLAQQVVQHPADPSNPTGPVAAPPFMP
jgi:hypothetical protein